jgi:hypothetical protein
VVPVVGLVWLVRDVDMVRLAGVDVLQGVVAVYCRSETIVRVVAKWQV